MTKSTFSFRLRLHFLTIFIPPLLAFTSPSVWAHDDDDVTTAELNAALELVFQQLQNNVWVEPSEVGTPNPDVGYFVVGDQKVAFRKSAMSQAITGVLLAQARAEQKDCLDILPSHQCTLPTPPETEAKKNRILAKVLDILLAPYHLVEPYVRDPVGVGVGSVVRLTNEFGVSVFMFIISSQTAWEILESIGLGPAHTACVAFNIALFAATRSAVDFGTMVCERGSGIPLKKRAAIGAASFRRTIQWGWQLARKILYSNGSSQIISRRGDYSTQNPVPHSVLWEQAIQGEFFSSMFVANQFPEAGFDSIQTSDDIAFVYSDAPKVERFVIAHQYMAGIEFAGELVRRYMMAKRQEGTLDSIAMLSAQRALGTWGRNKNYYASMLRMGSLDEEASVRAGVEGRIELMTVVANGLLKDLHEIRMQIDANSSSGLSRVSDLIRMHRDGFKSCQRQLTL